MTIMFSILQLAAGLWLISHCSAYELQDTIHTLKEENFHLQHRLENLTRALRDLKHLLAEHSKGESRAVSLLDYKLIHFQNGSSEQAFVSQFLWGDVTLSFCTPGGNGPNTVRSPSEV